VFEIALGIAVCSLMFKIASADGRSGVL